MAQSQPGMPAGRPPSGPVSGGRIVSQQRVLEVGPDGRPQSGYRIEFLTGAGAAGSAFVPEAMYEPANVIAAVRAMAAKLDEVQRTTI